MRRRFQAVSGRSKRTQSDRFSVEKLWHGKRHRSGWKNQHPSSLADHDTELLNMAIEAWASNAIKHNFDPKFVICVAIKWYTAVTGCPAGPRSARKRPLKERKTSSGIREN